jgi:dTDP-4-dehydrorhamnose 3,5-epimerase-like enzyme
MASKIEIKSLENLGDGRGYSFTAPAEALAFVGVIKDAHFSSMVPGAVRGNHFHLRRREAIVVLHDGPWSFHWDEGDEATSQHQEFSGCGAQLILVSPGASHAVKNNGARELRLVAFSSEPYDPSETVARKVV